jgi:hypothetical protein
MLEIYPPYGDEKAWPLWRIEARTHLPDPWPEYVGKAPEDDREYDLYYRLVALDPMQQQSIGEMRMLSYKNNQVLSDRTYTLTSNYYFLNEMHMLLKQARLTVEAEKGDWTDADASADHNVIVFFARKP